MAHNKIDNRQVDMFQSEYCDKPKEKMKVLVACEESQRVCTAFRERGHEAYSCDILPPSGGHPEWHTKQDVLPILNGHCFVKTMDGQVHQIEGKWDLIIAHPPCTYLTVTGNRWFDVEKYGDKARERERERERHDSLWSL